MNEVINGKLRNQGTLFDKVKKVLTEEISKEIEVEKNFLISKLEREIESKVISKIARIVENISITEDICEQNISINIHLGLKEKRGE